MTDVGDTSFSALVEEAAAASVDGWDFSWLDERATEQRPSWGYARTMAGRLADPAVGAALDVQTGGGEVLASATTYPTVMVATEGWPPNLAQATALLHPRGVAVVADDDEPPLPFADAAFDLVVSRHPVTVWWDEIARVLRPGGTYFSQQVGPSSMFELVEWFLGPQPTEVHHRRHPDRARAGVHRRGLRTAAAPPPRADRPRRPVRGYDDEDARRAPEAVRFVRRAG
ncbi:MAG: class I SAM-dependent methyltransferase [Ilumatobacteraceae bacterium]